MPYNKANNIIGFNNILKIKQEVYNLTFTESTKQLKKTHPGLTKNKDLRKKENWISLYNTLKLIDNFQQEQASKQLAQEFGFTTPNGYSTFQDLLRNVTSMRKLMKFIEKKLLD